MKSGEWADAAREVVETLRVEMPDIDSNLFCGKDGKRCANENAFLHELRAEATRLFVGAPSPAVSPYEAIWRAGSDGVKGLLFVNPHSQNAERFMRSCGLDRPEGTNEPLDHVATEFNLLAYLAQIASGLTPVVNGFSMTTFPGGSASAAYGLFLNEHVLTWVPDFAESLAEESRLPFYRTVATLTRIALC